MQNGLLEANEVCALVGCSVYTLNLWYQFKYENPENEYSLILPDIIHLENSRKRYWNPDDIDKLINFKTAIPKGRNGVLGNVTQRYKKRKVKENGTKEF